MSAKPGLWCDSINGNDMLQKKICLLGAFSVGKTSLIRRFVNSMFDARYFTTVGVKVDKKVVTVSSEEVMLLIWDISGEDEFQRMSASYLRGAAGYVVVVDGTRPKSYNTALAVQQRAVNVLGDVPAVTAVNKVDLVDSWVFTREQEDNLKQKGSVLYTSAKTGENVEQLFEVLARAIL